MAGTPSADKGMAKLLGRALGQKLDASGKDCPDASVLAAYFDHELPSEEAAPWELHFSTCARCQRQLAALARAEPPAEQAAAQEPGRARRFWDLRWIAPLATAAAAGALWIALHPTLPNLEEQPAPPRTPAGTPAAETSEAPARPAAQKEGATRLRAEPGEKKRGASEGISGGTKTDELGRVSAPVATARSAGAAVSEAVPGGMPQEKPEGVAPKEAGRFSATQAQMPPEAALKAKAAPFAAAGAASRDSAAPTAVPAQPSPKAPETQAGAAALQRNAGTLGRVTILAEHTPELRVAAPGGQVMWRFGPEGTVEHSRDAGKTWKGQFLKDTAALLAGSAPSEKVCWVVGAAGTVLRTTDGERWEKAAAPTQANLIFVEARDAQHAAVTAADGRIYRTNDGGRTWLVQ